MKYKVPEDKTYTAKEIVDTYKYYTNCGLSIGFPDYMGITEEDPINEFWMSGRKFIAEDSLLTYQAENAKNNQRKSMSDEQSEHLVPIISTHQACYLWDNHRTMYRICDDGTESQIETTEELFNYLITGEALAVNVEHIL